MARTRGVKSSSPSSHLRIPRETPIHVATPEPPWPPIVSPLIEDAPMSPPLRRYETRRPPTSPGASSSRAKKSGSRPPKKKAKVSEPIDLTESSLELESEPQPSQPPVKKPQPSQPLAKESQIPAGMTLEVVIRCSMVTQPPIEGNLDCRARPFHSELCFDTATFRLQPELRDYFHLL